MQLPSQLEEMFSSVGQNTIIATWSSSDCHPGRLKYLTCKWVYLQITKWKLYTIASMKCIISKEDTIITELLDWSVLGGLHVLCGKLEDFVNFPCSKFLRSLQGSFSWAFSPELNLTEVNTQLYLARNKIYKGILGLCRMKIYQLEGFNDRWAGPRHSCPAELLNHGAGTAVLYEKGRSEKQVGNKHELLGETRGRLAPLPCLCCFVRPFLVAVFSQMLWETHHKGQGCVSCPLSVASGSSSPIFRALCSRTEERFSPPSCSPVLPAETCHKAWEISMETVHRENQQLPQLFHRFVFHNLNSFYFFTAFLGHQVQPFCLVYFCSL